MAGAEVVLAAVTVEAGASAVLAEAIRAEAARREVGDAGQVVTT
jgi:hypothetical protein